MGLSPPVRVFRNIAFSFFAVEGGVGIRALEKGNSLRLMNIATFGIEFAGAFIDLLFVICFFCWRGRTGCWAREIKRKNTEFRNFIIVNYLRKMFDNF